MDLRLLQGGGGRTRRGMVSMEEDEEEKCLVLPKTCEPGQRDEKGPRTDRMKRGCNLSGPRLRRPTTAGRCCPVFSGPSFASTPVELSPKRRRTAFARSRAFPPDRARDRTFYFARWTHCFPPPPPRCFLPRSCYEYGVSSRGDRGSRSSRRRGPSTCPQLGAVGKLVHWGSGAGQGMRC